MWIIFYIYFFVSLPYILIYLRIRANVKEEFDVRGLVGTWLACSKDMGSKDVKQKSMHLTSGCTLHKPAWELIDTLWWSLSRVKTKWYDDKDIKICNGRCDAPIFSLDLLRSSSISPDLRIWKQVAHIYVKFILHNLKFEVKEFIFKMSYLKKFWNLCYMQSLT